MNGAPVALFLKCTSQVSTEKLRVVSRDINRGYKGVGGWEATLIGVSWTECDKLDSVCWRAVSVRFNPVAPSLCLRVGAVPGKYGW